MKYHDVSVPITNGMVVWPGHPRVEIGQVAEIDKGSECNVSRMGIDCHAATHVDAPCHFLREGAGVDDIPLASLIGPAYVAEIPDARRLSADLLDRPGIPAEAERLLFKTSNSELWAKPSGEFREDYVGLDRSGARWIVDRGIKLVGVDYLSVALFEEAAPVHRLLLRAEVVPLEGVDLRRVSSGWYRLICLPVKLAGCDGAPARVVLVEE